MKKTALFLLIAFTCIYPVPGINPVSPYINRAVSLNFSTYHNPFFIEFNYKREASGDQYVAYANDLYLTQSWARTIYIVIGSENEENEFLALVSPFLLNSIKFRHKYNAFELGEDKIFRNISVSSFLGISSVGYRYQPILSAASHPAKNNGYTQYYFGTAFGTRKSLDDFSYFEIFASPQISRTHYSDLGGGSDYNPVGELNPNWYNWSQDGKSFNVALFDVTVWDFSMPIGVGIKYRYFFTRTGFAVTATFGGEKRSKKGGQLIVDSYNFPQIPFFMECGIHFRKFRKLERKEIDEEIDFGLAVSRNVENIKDIEK